MKKIIFCIAALVSVNAHAQKFQLGFTGGLTVANYQANGDNGDQSSDPKAGFTLGTLARISIKRHLIFQPEINWVQKGTTENQSQIGNVDKITLTTNHIEVPLNILYTTKNGFFVGGGPSFSFAVSGKLQAHVGDNEESKKVHYGNKSDDIMKGFDFGGNLLVGFKFKNNILVTANGNIGISNLSNTIGTETLTSYYFGIKAGYLFHFKK